MNDSGPIRCVVPVGSPEVSDPIATVAGVGHPGTRAASRRAAAQVVPAGL